jgi:hypothetical protein
MNMPGFTAEACIYSTRNYYTINVPGVGAGIRTIVASLISDGGGAFKCTGTCPEGSMLCTGTQNCQCCKTGCATKDGWVYCTHDPITIVAAPSSLGGSQGSVVF